MPSEPKIALWRQSPSPQDSLAADPFSCLGLPRDAGCNIRPIDGSRRCALQLILDLRLCFIQLEPYRATESRSIQAAESTAQEVGCSRQRPAVVRGIAAMAGLKESPLSSLRIRQPLRPCHFRKPDEKQTPGALVLRLPQSRARAPARRRHRTAVSVRGISALYGRAHAYSSQRALLRNPTE
jgi:hypothetical protein